MILNDEEIVLAMSFTVIDMSVCVISNYIPCRVAPMLFNGLHCTCQMSDVDQGIGVCLINVSQNLLTMAFVSC